MPFQFNAGERVLAEKTRLEITDGQFSIFARQTGSGFPAAFFQ